MGVFTQNYFTSPCSGSLTQTGLGPDVPCTLLLCVLGLLGIGNMVGIRAAKDLSFHIIQTKEKKLL